MHRTQCFSTEVTPRLTPSFVQISLAVIIHRIFMQLAAQQGVPFRYHCREGECSGGRRETVPHSSLHHDTELKSTAEVDLDKTHVLPDENIVTVAPNVSVSRKCCSSHTVPIYKGYTSRSGS